MGEKNEFLIIVKPIKGFSFVGLYIFQLYFQIMSYNSYKYSESTNILVCLHKIPWTLIKKEAKKKTKTTKI